MDQSCMISALKKIKGLVMTVLPTQMSQPNTQTAQPVQNRQQQDERAKTDSKINWMLITGRILQAAAVVIAAASIGSAFVLSPLTLLGFIPAVALGVLGSWMTRDLRKVFTSTPAGKPVGLINNGQNCWVNATFQFLNSVPAYQQRMDQIPFFKQQVQSYQKSQSKKDDFVGEGNFKIRDRAQEIREYMHAQNDEVPADIEEPFDSSTIVEHLFQGERGQMMIQTTENAVRQVYEPFVEVHIDDLQVRGNRFQTLFNDFFQYYAGDVQVNRNFQSSPDDLLIKVRRFNLQDVATPQGQIVQQRVKISDPVEMPQELVLEGRFANSNANQHYTCDAFIEHRGTSLQGGHYVAYVKRNGLWWLCNDSRISQVNESEAFDAMNRAYFFHFRKLQLNHQPNRS